MTDNGEPFKAGVYTSFDGFLAVPEPTTWTILLAGLAASGLLRRRAPRSAHNPPAAFAGRGQGDLPAPRVGLGGGLRCSFRRVQSVETPILWSSTQTSAHVSNIRRTHNAEAIH
jgi:hypothetical protein